MVSTVRSRPNCYETLGLTPTAAADEIAQAFARKSSVFRPHAFGGITEVCVAYETLRDPIKRQVYDASLGLKPELDLRDSSTGPRGQPSSPGSVSTNPVERTAFDTLLPTAPQVNPKPPSELSTERTVGSFIAASLRQPVNPKARDSSPAPTPQLELRHGLRADAKARLEPQIGGDRLRHLALEERLDVEVNPIEWKRIGMAVGAAVVASCLLGALAGWWSGNEVGEPPQRVRAVSISLPPANPLATTAAPRLVAAAPAYQGADEYRRIPFPAIDNKKGWFFANPRDGIGIAPIDTDTVTVGAGAVFIPGYGKRDVPDGIDRLSSGGGGRLFATARAGGFVATIGAAKGVSGGTEGMIADTSLSYPVEISSRVKLTPTIGASWASRRHNNAYYGVTESEALASGLQQFSAGSGFKDVSASLAASYRLTDRITVSAAGGATSLLGNVGDSPRVVHKTQPSGIMALSYRY